jgi:hypothetical protein
VSWPSAKDIIPSEDTPRSSLARLLFQEITDAVGNFVGVGF